MAASDQDQLESRPLFVVSARHEVDETRLIGIRSATLISLCALEGMQRPAAAAGKFQRHKKHVFKESRPCHLVDDPVVDQEPGNGVLLFPGDGTILRDRRSACRSQDMLL